ncbi:glutaredoxin family protein, partial [Metasolibacillus meyeri]|uniref:glutaredoxin family protein n=1 Tax=Metasolibacillus meyeri TaxID=1071052 RepID=UPI000D3086CF
MCIRDRFYSDHCIYCTNLIKWLTERDISFISINISDPDASIKAMELGIKAVPFTIIEDMKTKIKEEVIGFNIQKLQKILY